MPASKRFLLLFGALWAGLFVASLDFADPVFRAYEALRAVRNFTPNQRVRMVEYGSLSWRTGIEEVREPHETVFTTDAYGYRNDPALGWAKLLVVGDSFVVGVGVSDDETLPVVLSEALGEPVYNFGAEYVHAPGLSLHDPRLAASPPELVVLMPSLGAPGPLVLEDTRHLPPPESAIDRALERWAGMQERLTHEHDRIERDQGLRRPARRLFGPLERSLVPHPDMIQIEGEPALARSLRERRMDRSPEQLGLRRIVASYVAYRDALAARGIGLVIAPIPGSAELYLDQFPAAERARVHSERLYDALSAAIDAAGIPRIDLFGPLHAQRFPYLFWRDDNHWNPRAIRIAAEVIAEAIRTHPQWRDRAAVTVP